MINWRLRKERERKGYEEPKPKYPRPQRGQAETIVKIVVFLIVGILILLAII